MVKDKRVEVLFEPGEYKVLEDAAHRSGKSVGAMVREAVAKYVVGPTEERRKEARRKLLEFRNDLGDVDWDQIKRQMARDDYRRVTGEDPPDFGDDN